MGGVAFLLYHALNIYSYVLLAAVLASWVAPGSNHPVVRFLDKVTDPVLKPIRKVLPSAGGIDFSPLLAFLAIRLIQRLLF